MRHSGIGVRFPLLSSVFFPLRRSAALGLAALSLSRPALSSETRTERMIGPGVKCITLVRDTPRFGLSTRTNAAGTEAVLTGIELPMRLGQTYRARVAAVADRGDTPIPADGVVLSAHGAARSLLQGLKEGDELQIRLDFD